MYILVLGVVGLAVTLGKNVYCFWLCPFSAVQEGMQLLNSGKTQPSLKWRRIFRQARYVVLWLAIFLVLILRNPGISVFEPWNALFSFKGPFEQWILVFFTLAAAILVHNFWCYYSCPVGAAMDIILKLRRRGIELWQKLIGNMLPQRRKE
jgi:polyferredoxin